MTGPATCDVVVIGGGPAGLSAVLRLAAAGMSVVLVDEQPELGGQYFHRPAPAVLERAGDRRPAGGRLIAAVRAAGVDCRTGTTVWGLGDDGRTLLTSPVLGSPAVSLLAGRFIVVATGAYERVIPFPGWELPGVTTAGFAQHLAVSGGVAVGRRVLVAGSGPFLLPVACSLLDLGVTVVGVAEAGRPYRPSVLGVVTAVRFPARLAELAGYTARLARGRVPLWQGRIVARADADDTGQHIGSVTLAATGAPDVPVAAFDVDALCVGTGFRPQSELTAMLGCAVRPDPLSGDLLPVTDADGRSSRPDVYIAGEAAGVGGAAKAAAEGELVAAAILARTGHPAARDGAAARRRQRSFAALTARLYPPAGGLTRALAAALPDEVRVCRCEAVTAGEIRTAAAVLAADTPGSAGSADLGAVRGLTRAGMGPCQGRECLATVAALCGPGPVMAGTPRMPGRPVPLGAIASLAGQVPS